MNEQTQEQAVLDRIRETRTTESLPAESFKELCRATCFYLKGKCPVEDAARMVIEEVYC